MRYVIEFTSPVMKDKMYFHETRVLVDKKEKATQYETKEEISIFETFKKLSLIGYRDFSLNFVEYEN
jgi:hypothetical protein